LLASSDKKVTSCSFKGFSRFFFMVNKNKNHHGKKMPEALGKSKKVRALR
jgi:hypothetical protein